MKYLHLIRHAKSSWKDPNQQDKDRPLNKRGKRDAPMMGSRLRSQDVLPDLILSSPARRALKTAKIVAVEIGYPEIDIEIQENIYLGGIRELMNTLREIDNRYQRVFLFGHNPTITDLANSLARTHVNNIPTCGIFSCQFPVDSWEEVDRGKGVFVSFDYPKKDPDYAL
ncbi:histidine phosphatase family protein [Acidobacteriota bacterium]